MMTNLMTISVKKASISSKPTTVYLSCPPLCGLFSIQQNANGGLSYKAKKNPENRCKALFYNDFRGSSLETNKLPAGFEPATYALRTPILSTGKPYKTLLFHGYYFFPHKNIIFPTVTLALSKLIFLCIYKKII